MLVLTFGGKIRSPFGENNDFVVGLGLKFSRLPPFWLLTFGHTRFYALDSLTGRCVPAAAWLSGSSLVSINEVTLLARLLLGWVTVCAGKPPRFVTSQSGQLSLLPSAGRKMGISQTVTTRSAGGE